MIFFIAVLQNQQVIAGEPFVLIITGGLLQIFFLKYAAARHKANRIIAKYLKWEAWENLS